MNPLRDCRALLLAELLNRPAPTPAAADPLRQVFASMLAGRSLHQGVLSATLGLPEAEFQTLWASYFPGEHLNLQDGPSLEMLELDDLRKLLLDHRAGVAESEVWMAHMVAYGCSGHNHLWQDLGLANRDELSTLMTAAFPSFAAQNSGDMKWKKFIYRHYCSREGIYVCPAPSCSECADHAKCFSPEV
jgi:nitrogen fixation protein NifQ